ncbi:MAG: extracellular solute-binding protein [Anaerolineae bacterium]|nr:extracellular solute-binding protein [Anaerolineae bacterium]
MDTKLDQMAKAWGEKNKVEVKVEHININDIPARRAAAIQAKTGPDLIWDSQNWGTLFKDALVDITDVMTEANNANGGWYKWTDQFTKADGKYVTVPHGFSGGTFIYRADWFKQNGVTVPKTYDDFTKAAETMKKAGKPFGQAVGHSFGDPPGFWYPYLWAYGGKEVEQDGKTVAINTKETIGAIERAVDMYKRGFVDAGLAWDDSANNRSYLAEEIACTENGSSIYFVAGRDAAKGDERAKRVRENSDHFAKPAGPNGASILAGGYYTGIMNYSKNVNAGKDFLRYMLSAENYLEWLGSGSGYLQGLAPKYADQPIFKTDPKMKPFVDNLTQAEAKWLGSPGPLSAAAFRVYNNYTIVDMFAKAISGELKPDAAAKWAEDQLKNVYK